MLPATMHSNTPLIHSDIGAVVLWGQSYYLLGREYADYHVFHSPLGSIQRPEQSKLIRGYWVNARMVLRRSLLTPFFA